MTESEITLIKREVHECNRLLTVDPSSYDFYRTHLATLLFDVLGFESLPDSMLERGITAVYTDYNTCSISIDDNGRVRFSDCVPEMN